MVLDFELQRRRQPHQVESVKELYAWGKLNFFWLLDVERWVFVTGCDKSLADLVNYLDLLVH